MLTCGVVCEDVHLAVSFGVAALLAAMVLFAANWLLERRPWRNRRGYVKRAWLAGEWQLWLWDERESRWTLAWRERIAGSKAWRRKLAATAEWMEMLIESGELWTLDLAAVEPFVEEEEKVA